MANPTVAQPCATTEELKTALRSADMYAQIADDRIRAMCEAILSCLKEPDSGLIRLRIKTLVDAIEFFSGDAMNAINCTAERRGASYENATEQQLTDAILSAATPSFRQ